MGNNYHDFLSSSCLFLSGLFLTEFMLVISLTFYKSIASFNITKIEAI